MSLSLALRSVRLLLVALGAFAAVGSLASDAAAQNYKLERVASGLNQPTYVTQAPGDNNSLFIVERVGDSIANIGRILRKDLTTGETSVFLNPMGTTTADGGLLSMAFHPDYETNGKFYIAMTQGPGIVNNQVREYTMVNGSPTYTKLVLSYDQKMNSAYHTVNWVGFKPGATGAERNELYITTGDGGPMANNVNYVNDAQNLNSIFGKVLRVDISEGADAYPGNPDKNFGIPARNNFAGAPSKLGEVIVSGLRNPYRVSFDRATGDMYVGDVGYDAVEEVNFIKADVFNNPTSVPDYGWAKREGRVQTPNAAPGIGGPKGDSLNPIFFRTASSADDGYADNSITGGYVYRGPIPELQGKYFFADLIADKIYAIEFDRDTNPANFGSLNSTIANTGVKNFQDVTELWESLIDSPGANYLRKTSSFGEDNLGNLYIVKFNNSPGSNTGYYSQLGQGEIFRVVPVPEPATLALLAMALPAVYCVRRYRRAA